MLQIRVLVTLLLILALSPFTSECLSQRSTVGKLKEKRWHSIKTADKVEDGQERPWPPAVGDPNGPAQVPYCFLDGQAAISLHKLLAKALRKWRPALQKDRVAIIPDPACPSESWCLCSFEGVSPLTLRISLTDSAYGYSGHGYNDKNVNDVRHSLCARPGKDVLSMAHEIGHVLGLVHEHQRPDASQYITFDCEALPSYEEAKQRISQLENHPKLPITMMPDERMQIVCANPRLAKMYFREAWHWMPWPRPSKEYTNARAYDFDSIMHYPSSPKTGPPYALLRHKKDLSHGEPTDPENLIYMGGNKDPKEAGPTEMDIERVKALYPRKRLSAGTQSPSVDTKPGAADDDDDNENPGSGDGKPGTATDKRQASRARRRALRARLSLELDPNDDHEGD